MHLDLWFKFLLASGLVVVAGLSLTRHTERLAAALGWGHAFAGFIVLGWATSLPEVTISLSAVGAVDSPALAVGNISGSVLFNLAILAGLDLLSRRSGVGGTGPGLFSLGGFNLALLGGALFLALHGEPVTDRLPTALGVLLLGGYLLATAHAWWRQRGESGETGDLDDPAGAAGGDPAGGLAAEPRAGARSAALRCLAAGAVILVAGIWLAHLGDALGEAHGLDEGFVGTLFLACVSSLPELVTGLAAVRLGLFTLAAGSILGSNIFNLGVLGVCDLVHQAGDGASAATPLLAAAEAESPDRVVANLGACLLMTMLAMIGLALRRGASAGRLRPLVSWGSLLLYLNALSSGGITD